MGERSNSKGHFRNIVVERRLRLLQPLGCEVNIAVREQEENLPIGMLSIWAHAPIDEEPVKDPHKDCRWLGLKVIGVLETRPGQLIK